MAPGLGRSSAPASSSAVKTLLIGCVCGWIGEQCGGCALYCDRKQERSAALLLYRNTSMTKALGEEIIGRKKETSERMTVCSPHNTISAHLPVTFVFTYAMRPSLTCAKCASSVIKYTL